VEATVKLDEWPGPDWQGAGDMSVETRNGGAAKSCGKNGDFDGFYHFFPMQNQQIHEI
jgi:hypothetical protein